MHQHQRTTFGRRVIAAFCAALVLALGVFAASPSLHRQLHHNAHTSCDDGCAVTLFANGVTTAAVLDAPPPPSADWQRVAFVCAPEVVIASTPHRLQPGRGPPAA